MVDGDQLMALIALGLQRRGDLKGDAVVATVMSNLGLERKLGEAVSLMRTKVGDRYVLEEMRRSGCNVGGEQSGHIILTIMRPPATGWLQAFRCWRRWSKPSTRERVAEAIRAASAAAQECALQPGCTARGGQRRKRIAAAEAELEGGAVWSFANREPSR